MLWHLTVLLTCNSWCNPSRRDHSLIWPIVGSWNDERKMCSHELISRVRARLRFPPFFFPHAPVRVCARHAQGAAHGSAMCAHPCAAACLGERVRGSPRAPYKCQLLFLVSANSNCKLQGSCHFFRIFISSTAKIWKYWNLLCTQWFLFYIYT